MQRQLIKDGVFYLDFKNVQDQSQIENLFLLNGLDYILRSQEQIEEKSNKKSAGNKHLLLIYDNIDEIEKDKIVFKFHLSILMKSRFKIKVITTRRDNACLIEELQENLIHLEALSTQQSAQLVKIYCLRDLQVKELQSYVDECIGEEKSSEVDSLDFDEGL